LNTKLRCSYFTILRRLRDSRALQDKKTIYIFRNALIANWYKVLIPRRFFGILLRFKNKKMRLKHSAYKDTFLKNRRFVLLAVSTPGEDRDGSLDAREADINGGGKTDLEITARDVNDGGQYLDDQVSRLLDHINTFDGGAMDRMHKLLGKVSQTSSDKHVDNAVHDYHEGAALGVITRANEKLDEAAVDTTHKVKNIRKGRVDKWGEGEVAIVSQKLTELRRSKENLSSAITQNKQRATNYTAFLQALRDPDLSERFWSKARRRISKSRFKSLSAMQPERFNELNRAKASVQRVETETASAKKAYEARHKQEFKKSIEVSNKFKQYLLSIPAFAKDSEMKLRFDEFLKQDQLKGAPDDDSEMMKRLDRAFNDKAITAEEYATLRELYGTLFTKKDVKMRRMEAAMNLKTKVNKINRKTLEKMPVGQLLSVTYPALAAVRVSEDGNRTVDTRETTQNAYVSDSQDGKLVLKVQYSDISKLGKIKRTDKEKVHALGMDHIYESTTEYTPKSQTIRIDLGTGEMTTETEALYTNKDGKAVGVTLRDSRKFEADDETNTFKGINFAGDVLNDAIS